MSQPISVVAGLVPAIHVFLAGVSKDVDARDKPGHDDLASFASHNYFPASFFTAALIDAAASS